VASPVTQRWLINRLYVAVKNKMEESSLKSMKIRIKKHSLLKLQIQLDFFVNKEFSDYFKGWSLAETILPLKSSFCPAILIDCQIPL
jgi:hypothetical protein